MGKDRKTTQPVKQREKQGTIKMVHSVLSVHLWHKIQFYALVFALREGRTTDRTKDKHLN